MHADYIKSVVAGSFHKWETLVIAILSKPERTAIRFINL